MFRLIRRVPGRNFVSAGRQLSSKPLSEEQASFSAHLAEVAEIRPTRVLTEFIGMSRVNERKCLHPDILDTFFGACLKTGNRNVAFNFYESLERRGYPVDEELQEKILQLSFKSSDNPRTRVMLQRMLSESRENNWDDARKARVFDVALAFYSEHGLLIDLKETADIIKKEKVNVGANFDLHMARGYFAAGQFQTAIDHVRHFVAAGGSELQACRAGLRDVLEAEDLPTARTLFSMSPQSFSEKDEDRLCDLAEQMGDVETLRMLYARAYQSTRAAAPPYHAPPASSVAAEVSEGLPSDVVLRDNATAVRADWDIIFRRLSAYFRAVCASWKEPKEIWSVFSDYMVQLSNNRPPETQPESQEVWHSAYEECIDLAASSFSRSSGRADDAFDTLSMLKDKDELPENIASEALDVVVLACAIRADLPRALETYALYDAWGTTPTTRTYNALLRATSRQGHEQAMDRIVELMQQGECEADSLTYHYRLAMALRAGKEDLADKLFGEAAAKEVDVQPGTIELAMCLYHANGNRKKVLELYRTKANKSVSDFTRRYCNLK